MSDPMTDLQKHVEWLIRNNSFTCGVLWFGRMIESDPRITFECRLLLSDILDKVTGAAKLHADSATPITDNRDSLDSKLASDPVQQGLERDIVGAPVSDDAAGDVYLSTHREGGAQ